MGEESNSSSVFFGLKVDELKRIILDCLHAFYENEVKKDGPILILDQMINRIPQISELELTKDLNNLITNSFRKKKAVTEMEEIPTDLEIFIDFFVNQSLHGKLYYELDPKSEFKKMRDIFPNLDENDERRFVAVIDEHNIRLSNQKCPNFTIITEFHKLYSLDPLLCSELLAGLRKFCDVSKPPQYDFIKPSIDYCITNFDEKTDMFLDSKIEPEQLFEAIDGLSSLMNSKSLISTFILAYERGMISKFNKDFYKALRIFENMEEVVKRFAKHKHSLKNFLDHIKNNDGTIDHQMFTFRNPLVYIEFQINLLKNRLGQQRITWNEIDDTDKNISSNMRGIRKATKEIGYLHPSIFDNSKDRVLVHVDTLMRRNHPVSYDIWIKSEGKDWENELLSIKTNTTMKEFLKYRWGGSEDWSSKTVSKFYIDKLKEIKEEITSSDSHTNGSIVRARYPFNGVKDDYSLNNWVADKWIGKNPREMLNKIGDIAINNPLYRHSSGGSFSFLSFIHAPRDIPPKAQEKDMENLFDIENNTKGFERILITNHSMITDDIGKINRSNIYADAAFLNSLRVEKLRKNSEAKTGKASKKGQISHSTGNSINCRIFSMIGIEGMSIYC